MGYDCSASCEAARLRNSTVNQEREIRVAPLTPDFSRGVRTRKRPVTVVHDGSPRAVNLKPET